MRLYINGKMSVEQECFHPSVLWFSTGEAEETDYVSKDCVCLEAYESESHIEGREFSCRWKGVDFRREVNGEIIEVNPWSTEEFLAYITENKMRLRNVTACYDKPADITIWSVVITDGDKRYDLDPNLFDVIEFI